MMRVYTERRQAHFWPIITYTKYLSYRSIQIIARLLMVIHSRPILEHHDVDAFKFHPNSTPNSLLVCIANPSFNPSLY